MKYLKYLFAVLLVVAVAGCIKTTRVDLGEAKPNSVVIVIHDSSSTETTTDASGAIDALAKTLDGANKLKNILPDVKQPSTPAIPSSPAPTEPPPAVTEEPIPEESAEEVTGYQYYHHTSDGVIEGEDSFFYGKAIIVQCEGDAKYESCEGMEYHGEDKNRYVWVDNSKTLKPGDTLKCTQDGVEYSIPYKSGLVYGDCTKKKV